MRQRAGATGAAALVTALVAPDASAAPAAWMLHLQDTMAAVAAALGQAAEPTPTPPPRPQHAPGAAKALAALARFAGGQAGTGHDARVAAALGKLPAARATARRVVQPFEAMAPAELAAMFAGAPAAATATRNEYDRASFEAWRDLFSEAAQQRAAQQRQRSVATLAPDPADAKARPAFELAYRGLQLGRAVDPEQELVVVTAVLWPGPAGEPARLTTRTVPASGALSLASGASATTGAGPLWSGATWPGGLVLVAAALDGGAELAQRKEELALVLELARAEAAVDGGLDPALALRREVEDAVDLLHLGGAWDPRSLQVRAIGGAEYDELHDLPLQASPAPHKLALPLGLRGAEATLLFEVPSPAQAMKTVLVTIKQIDALGEGRDRAENHLADFALRVAIDGRTPASAARQLARDRNSNRVGWTVERQVPAGSAVRISVQAWDVDPPPPTACVRGAGWPLAACEAACGAQEPTCAAGPPCPTYVGPCPALQVDYDLNPREDAEHAPARALSAVFDLGRNALIGDIDGPAGTYTITGTAGDEAQARIVVEVKQK